MPKLRRIRVPACMLALSAIWACAAPSLASAAEAGALLRSGRWHGDMVDFEPPAAFAQLAPAKWPADGWTGLHLEKGQLVATAQRTAPGQRPPFLQAIVLLNAKAPAGPKTLYVRIPGTTLREGTLATHRFKDGKAAFKPEQNQRHQIAWETRPLALTLELKPQSSNVDGESHRARFVAEYDGKKFYYELGGSTPDSLSCSIDFVADLDGDAKPDMLLSVMTGARMYEALLLSSLAKPGKNAVSASLEHIFD